MRTNSCVFITSLSDKSSTLFDDYPFLFFFYSKRGGLGKLAAKIFLHYGCSNSLSSQFLFLFLFILFFLFFKVELCQKGQYTNTGGGVNCVVRFSQFFDKWAQTLFAKAVLQLPRSGNFAKKSKRNNGYEIFTWKHV